VIRGLEGVVSPAGALLRLQCVFPSSDQAQRKDCSEQLDACPGLKPPSPFLALDQSWSNDQLFVSSPSAYFVDVAALSFSTAHERAAI
jgi:hypothetical protein